MAVFAQFQLVKDRWIRVDRTALCVTAQAKQMHQSKMWSCVSRSVQKRLEHENVHTRNFSFVEGEQVFNDETLSIFPIMIGRVSPVWHHASLSMSVSRNQYQGFIPLVSKPQATEICNRFWVNDIFLVMSTSEKTG